MVGTQKSVARNPVIRITVYVKFGREPDQDPLNMIVKVTGVGLVFIVTVSTELLWDFIAVRQTADTPLLVKKRVESAGTVAIFAPVTAPLAIIAVVIALFAIAVALEFAPAVTGPVNAARSKLKPFSVMEVEPV